MNQKLEVDRTRKTRKLDMMVATIHRLEDDMKEVKTSPMDDSPSGLLTDQTVFNFG